APAGEARRARRRPPEAPRLGPRSRRGHGADAPRPRTPGAGALRGDRRPRRGPRGGRGRGPRRRRPRDRELVKALGARRTRPSTLLRGSSTREVEGYWRKISTLSILMSSFGRSLRERGAFAILATTSWPLTTWPKTEWRRSR